MRKCRDCGKYFVGSPDNNVCEDCSEKTARRIRFFLWVLAGGFASLAIFALVPVMWIVDNCTVFRVHRIFSQLDTIREM